MSISDSDYIIYDQYKLNLKEIVMSLVQLYAYFFACAYIFYNFIPLSFLFVFAIYPYLKITKKKYIEKRKSTLLTQFKDMLYYLSVSLSSGLSLELAFKDTYRILTQIYPDKKSDMVNELEQIIYKISIGQQIETALYDFAKRSGVNEIKNFADVVSTCKRTGGNLVEITNSTSEIIKEKVDIKNNIAVTIAEKKLEQKIMGVMPFGIILLISILSKEYMQSVYTSFVGWGVMTISLVLTLFGNYVGKKIMDIEV